MSTIKNPGFIALVLCFLVTSCQVGHEQKELSVNSLFSDHMVLQQQEEVAFWGEYTPEEEVTVSGSWGKEASAIVDDNGNWTLRLSTPEAGGPFTVNIVTKDSTITLNDVMAGEVWLASGQSNMSMPVKGWPPNDLIDNSKEEIAGADYPGIRMFTVVRSLSVEPLDTLVGQWDVASPETAGEFSATAYFFARRIHRELNIPIGIIHTSWGGTVAEAWTSKSQLRKMGDFDNDIERLENASEQKTTLEWFSKWDTVAIPQTEKGWENIDFSNSEVTQPDFSDEHWSSIELPGRFDVYDSGALDGAFWFRKTIVIEDIESGYTLSIGFVDDMDATYVNGYKVGGLAGSGKYNVEREFTVPESILNKGENIIAIRAIDTGGPGIFGAPMLLTNKSGVSVSLEGTWKYIPVAEFYENKFYVYDINYSSILTRPNILKLHPNLPTVLFNAMIHPVIPFTIKGTIWYQGESNVSRAAQYKKLFPAMIEDWRQQWKSDFPFYFVQIAPFRYQQSGDVSLDMSQKLRDAQRHSLQTKNTGMVVTMDIGNFTNIHPSNKQDVGARLAGLALANDYGKQLVASGPLYKDHEISGNKMLLDFDYKGAGLVAKDADLSGFEIAGADKKYVPAVAIIVDDKVQVFAASIARPEYARYAWRDNGIATLFNKEGLPASSFTTEK